MVVYTLEQRWEVGLRLTYRKWRFWQKIIIFSDEAYFDLGGYVNKENCRIWGKENRHAYTEKPAHPKRVTVWCRFCSRCKLSHFSSKMSKERPLQSHAYIEKPTHPKRVTVWCGFQPRGTIGPFCFENEQGEAITVNGDRYWAMLNEFLFTKIVNEDIGNIWFQQDGATCHTDEAKLDVLRPVFKNHITSHRADGFWPPRSCDLTPLDYYLWGAVKDKCYADKPETIDVKPLVFVKSLVK